MWELLRKNIDRHVKLDDKEFEKVASQFIPRKYKRKQFILQEGDISKNESFILHGCTRTYQVDSDGHEHILQFSVEEWWCGDLYSFLSNTPATCHIECMEDCEVLQITRERQEVLFQTVPAMERFFRILIQNAFIASQYRVLNNLSKSGKERYSDFIGKYPHIEQRVPDHQIASYLGLTPQSLSRIRSQFRSGR